MDLFRLIIRGKLVGQLGVAKNGGTNDLDNLIF